MTNRNEAGSIKVSRGRRDLSTLAVEIAHSRPPADTSIEQFHMMADSMVNLCDGGLGDFLSDSGRVLFLGDDDHISILLASKWDLSPVVLEYDQRVIDSLTRWSRKLNLRSYEVAKYDVRDPVPPIEKCDTFYINPPYSSKNDGHGMRAWVTRSLEACVDRCDGVIIMPHSDTLSWVNDSWIGMQSFLAANGLRILTQNNRPLQMYDGTNDIGLQSEAVFVRRTNPRLTRKEPPRVGTALYR